MDGIEVRCKLAWPGFTLDVDLTLPGSGVTALFGHSGSGKTTLLRCLAGLERAQPGRLVFKGQIWQDEKTWRPTHQRPIGYVFQEASLFAHLDVLDNLRFGQKRSGSSGRVSLDAAIELLGIGHLLERKPDALSGGERQRVGIARALAVGPEILLMDEPLAALDSHRKAEVLPFIAALSRRFAIPILYVSHAMDEVLRLADTLVLMDEGRAAAVGGVEELLSRPDLRPLTGRYEAGAVIRAVVAGHQPEYGITHLSFAGGTLTVAQADVALGGSVRVRIHARDVAIALDAPDRISTRNILPATIRSMEERQDHLVDVVLDCGGVALWSQITTLAQSRLSLEPGMAVHALVKAVTIAGGDVADRHEGGR